MKLLALAGLVLAVAAPGARPAVKEPFGLAIAPDGSLIVVDRGGGAVVRVDPRTGTRGLIVRGLREPLTAAYDPARRLHVVAGERIWRIGPRGTKTLVAGTGVRGYDGDRKPATQAKLGGAGGIDFDAAGNLYVAEYDGRIRVIRPDGTIEPVAGRGGEGYDGDGGPATEAMLGAPHDVEALADGRIAIADSHNGAIRIVGTDGRITTLVRGLVAPVGVSERGGALYVLEARLGHVYRYTGRRRATVVRGLSVPYGLAVDARRAVYVSEFELRRVRAFAPGARARTLVP